MKTKRTLTQLFMLLLTTIAITACSPNHNPITEPPIPEPEPEPTNIITYEEDLEGVWKEYQESGRLVFHPNNTGELYFSMLCGNRFADYNYDFVWEIQNDTLLYIDLTQSTIGQSCYIAGFKILTYTKAEIDPNRWHFTPYTTINYFYKTEKE